MRALVVAALALSLAGCAAPVAGTASPVATPDPTEDPSAAASAGASVPVMDVRDMLMLKVIREGTSIPETQIPDSLMIGIADYNCGIIEVESTREGVQKAILNVSSANGLDFRSAGFIVGTSVAAQCPEYTGLLG